MLPRALRPLLFGAFALGATQGAVGWWMVKSGLEPRAPGDLRDPRVSPYRLTAHLAMAFTIYSVLLWSAIEAMHLARRVAETTAAQTASAAVAAAAANGSGVTARAQLAALRSITPMSWAAAGVIALTALSGAFVAGNDAGHAFNDWPLFAGRVVPEGLWDERMGARNLFENTATVQFDHRNLAYLTLATVGVLAHKVIRVKADMPAAVRTPLRAMSATVIAQIALGITTLMTYVPVSLGAAHQAGALALFSTAIWMRHAVSRATQAASRNAVAAEVQPAASAVAAAAAVSSTSVPAPSDSIVGRAMAATTPHWTMTAMHQRACRAMHAR